MSDMIGWQTVLPEMYAAANSTRTVPLFDEQQRAREVAERIAVAKHFPAWPLMVALIAFALPNGWIWGCTVLLVFGVVIYSGFQSAAVLASELHAETEQSLRSNREEVERLRAVVAAANGGDEGALQSLLTRWRKLRPDALRPIDIRLAGSAETSWFLHGRGLTRDDIPAAVPRIGRGGRTVLDKRKASEVDEDLSELNAAAALSILVALFSGGTAYRVTIRLVIQHPVSGTAIPWVTLSAVLNDRVLQDVLSPSRSPVDALRSLGGDVGRCRSKRYTAAKDPLLAGPGHAIPSAPSPTPVHPSFRSAERSQANSFGAMSPPAVPKPSRGSDDYGALAAEVQFGGPTRGSTPPSRAIPRPPATFAATNAVPTTRNVVGEFSTIARKFAAYEGDASARFIPFKEYYCEYSDMSAAQLKFYFKWRSAARRGEVIPTDLSYVFIYTYELLHLAGATNATHAAEQLEKLWMLYRGVYPALDRYHVRWITDLYASEVGTAPALEFARRAVSLGAAEAEEVLLVVDPLWAAADYEAIPEVGLSMLLCERHLGDTKFYRQYNTTTDGRPWVEAAFREAMATADRKFQAKHGRNLRAATVAENGLRLIAREAFQGAVYDWKRKRVVLGRVPAITDASKAVGVLKNAVRYTENLLREERDYRGKLRGIEVGPDLAAALDTEIAQYIRATKPKLHVTIDLVKAKELARESADVRARLLEGITEPLAPTSGTTPTVRDTGDAADSPVVPSSTLPLSTSETTEPAAHLLESGLLTDLAAVRTAITQLSEPSHALLKELAECGWETPRNAAVLSAAVGGVLIGPLVDEINQHALDSLGDLLLVHEGDTLVLQEDYRDEVYWVLEGTLDGFAPAAEVAARSAVLAAASASSTSATNVVLPVTSAGFGPVELRAVSLIASGGDNLSAALGQLAASHASTPLLLIDRVNECALSSSYGDILVNCSMSPPQIFGEARPFVDGILSQTAIPHA